MERTHSHRPADLPDWMGGPIPDGHTVPQPPRRAPEPVPLPEPERRRALALTAVLAVIAVAAIALGRLL